MILEILTIEWLLVIAYIDYLDHRICNSHILVLLFLGLLANYAALPAAILTAIIFSILSLLIYYFGVWGRGDVHLIGSLAFCIGNIPSMSLICAGSLILWAIFRRKTDAFAPYVFVCYLLQLMI
jgi:Flp pilus assembly protein protease CpaA